MKYRVKFLSMANYKVKPLVLDISSIENTIAVQQWLVDMRRPTLPFGDPIPEEQFLNFLKAKTYYKIIVT